MLRQSDSYCFLMIRDPEWAQILTLIGSRGRALCSNPDTPRVFPGAGFQETDASPHEDGRPFLFQAPLGYSLAPLFSLAVPAQVSNRVAHNPPHVAPQIRCLLVLLFVSSSCEHPHLFYMIPTYSPIPSSFVPSLSLGLLFRTRKSQNQSWS